MTTLYMVLGVLGWVALGAAVAIIFNTVRQRDRALAEYKVARAQHREIQDGMKAQVMTQARTIQMLNDELGRLRNLQVVARTLAAGDSARVKPGAKRTATERVFVSNGFAETLPIDGFETTTMAPVEGFITQPSRRDMR